MSAVIPVILCGGSGTRLWPLSRSDRPKQFISLSGDRTLLEGTLLRAAKIKGGGDPICVTAVAHGVAVRSSLERLGMRGRLLLEPCARGTAPALCAAALVAMRADPEAILVALPADHIIEDDTAFATSIGWAQAVARKLHTVVLGVTPRHAAAGFGYIMPGADFESFPHVTRVAKFIEKPSEEEARRLIERGALWNAGIVVARASAIVKSIGRYAPAVLVAVEKSLVANQGDTEGVALAAEEFAASPSISFDKAVLEKSADVAVAALHSMWRDVGTWDAVAELFSGDLDGNRHRGRVRLSASAGTFVFSLRRLVVGLGLKDLVVVDTPDALLVANRHNLGDLREVVAAMAGDDIPEVGTSEVQARSEAGDAAAGGIGIRRIALDAGKSKNCDPEPEVARQWIILEGTVQVTISKITSTYEAHGSFYLAPGLACKFDNGGTLPAKLLEVQLGGSS